MLQRFNRYQSHVLWDHSFWKDCFDHRQMIDQKSELPLAYINVSSSLVIFNALFIHLPYVEWLEDYQVLWGTSCTVWALLLVS